MKRITIRFTAGVDQSTVNDLLGIIDRHYDPHMAVTLLLSSTGGSIVDGLTAYNYLHGLPIDIVTQNIGSVDSIAVVLFCAGKQRLAIPSSSFLIHSTSWSPDDKKFQEKELKEKLVSLEQDRKHIAQVIASTCGKKPGHIEDMMYEGKTLNAKRAKAMGLVTDITTAIAGDEKDSYAIT